MMEAIEIARIDRRFEGTRIQNALQEKALLQSIVDQGLKEPLGCVMNADKEVILLDGFKRLRCCVRLNIGVAEVRFIGDDEISGIVRLLRMSQTQHMTLLEEAAFVDRLHREYGRSIIEIAQDVGRSPAWVSVRSGFIAEMSAYTRMRVFNGQFPARSYLYTLRRFTRVNNAPWKEVDAFVRAVSGKKLSTRDIEVLAGAYFHGDMKLKEQLCSGNVVWTLNRIKGRGYCNNRGLCEGERKTLHDLDVSQKYSKRALCGLKDTRHTTELFFKTACVLIEDILRELPVYQNALEEFYAFRRPKKSDTSAV